MGSQRSIADISIMWAVTYRRFPARCAVEKQALPLGSFGLLPSLANAQEEQIVPAQCIVHKLSRTESGSTQPDARGEGHEQHEEHQPRCVPALQAEETWVENPSGFLVRLRPLPAYDPRGSPFKRSVETTTRWPQPTRVLEAERLKQALSKGCSHQEP